MCEYIRSTHVNTFVSIYLDRNVVAMAVSGCVCTRANISVTVGVNMVVLYVLYECM